VMMEINQKTPTKKTKISLIFWSISDESSEDTHHKYYNTLEDNEHSYQIQEI
jgi:DNA polymerase-1